MGGDEAKAKPTRARFALAANVKHLMDNYSKGFAVGLTPVELEKGCGVSAKTIRRIIDPYSDTGPNLETIDQIAIFFRIEAWELLRPRPPALAAPWAEVTGPQKPLK
jgi:hypothetical protein